LDEPTNLESSPDWEQLNIKVRIGSLLFDFLLDSNFVPNKQTGKTEKHNHSAYEIQCIVSGSGVLYIQDTKISIMPNSVYLIGPGIFHCARAGKSDAITMITVRFTFKKHTSSDPWFLQRESDQIASILSDVRCHLFPDDAGKQAIYRIMEQLRTEILIQPFVVYTNVHSLFSQLIVEIVRSLRTSVSADHADALPKKSLDEMRLYIIDHFFAEFEKKLTVHMLAAKLNLSAKQVNRHLQQHYHRTFKQKLIDTRIEVAKDLLRNPELPIQAIAEKVGYEAMQNFCRLFRQRTGLTPSQFREKFK